MGNSWFQFKQFRVEQAGAALKVGTDACILGSWAHHAAPERVLDIGTGTGLLALMLAQRYSQAKVDALEPELNAALQALDNFRNSPWANRLFFHPMPVQEFFPDHRYDLIVCNPPFYPNYLKSDNAKRNLALHQEMLSFEELAEACSRLLHKDGLCYMLLPPAQAAAFEMQAFRNGLHVQQQLLVQERENTPVHRTIFSYAKSKPGQQNIVKLTIRSGSGEYSEHYKILLKEFYLKF